MKNISLIALALVCTASITHAAINITTFGSTAAPNFSLDNGLTTMTSVTVNSSNLDFSGVANQQISGEVPVVDISTQSTQLRITGSVTTNPGSTFGVRLTDSNFAEATYDGATWDDISTSGSAVLDLTINDPTFDFALVQFVDLIQGGSPSDSVAGTLTGLQAVPEPSTFFLIGLSGLALLARRRRG